MLNILCLYLTLTTLLLLYNTDIHVSNHIYLYTFRWGPTQVYALTTSIFYPGFLSDQANLSCKGWAGPAATSSWPGGFSLAAGGLSLADKA